MAKWNVRSYCLFNNRYLKNNSGMGVIGMAVALNVLIVLGGATLFMASEYEERNLNRSVKAAQLDDANKSALFLAGKLLEPNAKLLTMDTATNTFKTTNTFETWKDSPTYTFNNGVTVNTGAGILNPGGTPSYYPTTSPTPSPSPTSDKKALWSVAPPPSGKNLNVTFGFCDPNKQGTLSTAGVPINTMTCSQMVAVSLGNSGSNNMQIVSVNSTLDGITRSMNGARSMIAGGAFPWPKNLVLSGPAAGGAEVTFKPVQPGILIDVGGDDCPVIARTGDSATCRVPPHASGTVNISFKQGDGTPITDATPGTFQYLPAPEITQVLSPAFGPSTGGNPVTITGINFQVDSKVSVNGVDVGPLVSIDLTNPLQNKIIYNAPPSPNPGGGNVNVTVVNPALDIPNVLNNPIDPSSNPASYTYNNKPFISTISVNSGPQAGGNTVVIDGNAFVNGAGFQVTFNGTPATVSSFSATQLTVIAPAGTGGNSGPILVRNPDGQSSNNDKIYSWMFLPPVLSSLTNSSGPSSGGNQVFLNGSGFNAGARVSWSGSVLAAGLVTVLGGSQIRVSAAPGGSVGSTAFVKVINPDNQESGLQNYVYGNNPPAITSISPATGLAAGGTLVTINGSGFLTGARVRFGASTFTPSGLNFSATQLKFNTPAGAVGQVVNLFVENTDAQVSSNAAFTYVAGPPVLTTVSPNTGLPAGGGTITLTGSGFIKDQSKVVWNGSVLAAIPVGTNSTTTTLKFTLPAGALGNVNVAVENPDGQRSVNRTFTYANPPPPTVTGIRSGTKTVTGGGSKGGNTFTITGTGLTGAQVTFGTVPAASVSVNGAGTVITVTAPQMGSYWAQTIQVRVRVGTFTSSGFPYFVGGFTAKPNTSTTCHCWTCATTVAASGPWSSSSANGTYITGSAARSTVTGGCPTNGDWNDGLTAPYTNNVCAKFLNTYAFTCTN